MNGYEKRTKKKKDKIVKAAQDLFFAHGVANIKIADIAKKANVSQVTIYNYFGSKDKLLLEAMKQQMTHGLETSEDLFLEDIPFKEKMEKAITTKQILGTQLSKEFLDTVPWGKPEFQLLYKEMRAKSHRFIKRMIKQGKAEGAIHPSITLEAYIAYISAIDSLITHPDFMKTSNEYKRAIERLVWYGLIGK